MLEQILERYGFPALCLGVLAFALWRVAGWFAKQVAEPLIQSHVSLVKSVQQTNEDNAKNLEAIKERDCPCGGKPLP